MIQPSVTVFGPEEGVSVLGLAVSNCTTFAFNLRKNRTGVPLETGLGFGKVGLGSRCLETGKTLSWNEIFCLKGKPEFNK